VSQFKVERIELRPRGAFAKHVLGKLGRKTKETKNLYATAEDIRHTFAKEMGSLYRLSFLLTGNPRLAEQCFVAGLEDAVRENHVFKEWARSWAKHAIIRNAVRALRLSPFSPATSEVLGSARNISKSEDYPYVAVLALPDFERFVFVMTVLEEYCDHDTALLLDSSTEYVRDARLRALEQFATLTQAR
jgi:hypothetical protein